MPSQPRHSQPKGKDTARLVYVIVNIMASIMAFETANVQNAPFTRVTRGIIITTSSGFGQEGALYKNHHKDLITMIRAVQMAMQMMKDKGLRCSDKPVLEKYVSLVLASEVFARGFSRTRHAMVYMIGIVVVCLMNRKIKKIETLQEEFDSKDALCQHLEEEKTALKEDATAWQEEKAVLESKVEDLETQVVRERERAETHREGERMANYKVDLVAQFFQRVQGMGPRELSAIQLPVIQLNPVPAIQPIPALALEDMPDDVVVCASGSASEVACSTTPPSTRTLQDNLEDNLGAMYEREERAEAMASRVSPQR